MADPGSSERLVVIGASAGGVAALLELAERLPPRFGAPVCVVQHVGANASLLPELMGRAGPNPAMHARDGQHLLAGAIYVAPPDQHLLVHGHIARLSRGPRENHTRPAIDPLFRSAALGWGPRVIGVVLTGYMDDGTAGLRSIKDCGGVAVVEDPATAYEPSMPQSALAHVAVDHCLPLAAIPALLEQLVRRHVPEQVPPPPALVHEVAINRGEDLVGNLSKVARPSTLTCPDCGGSLWEVEGAPPLRYRCHTGHAYTVQSLERAQADSGEQNLRSAVRALAEREMLLRRMAAISQATGEAAQADAGRRQADRVREQIEALTALAQSAPAEPPRASGNA